MDIIFMLFVFALIGAWLGIMAQEWSIDYAGGDPETFGAYIGMPWKTLKRFWHIIAEDYDAANAE